MEWNEWLAAGIVAALWVWIFWLAAKVRLPEQKPPKG